MGKVAPDIYINDIENKKELDAYLRGRDVGLSLGLSISPEEGVYTKAEVDEKLDKKANKSDIVSAYSFCGSLEKFEDLPAIYRLIPCSEPIIHSENKEIDGTVWGSFDEDTHTVTVNPPTLGTDNVTIKVIPVTIKAGIYYASTPNCGEMNYPIDSHGSNIYNEVYTISSDQIITEVTIFCPYRGLNDGYEFGGSESVFTLYKLTPNDVEGGQNQWTCYLKNGSVYEVKYNDNGEEVGLNYGWTGSTWDALGTSHIDQEAKGLIANIEANIMDLYSGIDSVGDTAHTAYDQSQRNADDITNINGQIEGIETALDSIINIQNSLIGGEVE